MNSWSELARKETNYIFAQYCNLSTEKEKAEFKQWLFGQLLNPYRNGEFIGHWRNPIIEKRVAKRFGYLCKKYKV